MPRAYLALVTDWQGFARDQQALSFQHYSRLATPSGSRQRITVGLKKSQPHLADRWKAGHGVPQPVDRYPAGDARADHRHTEQIVVVNVDHHARTAGVTVGVEHRSLDDVADFDVDRVHS